MAGGWHFRGMVRGEGAERPVSHEVDAGRVFLLSDNRSLHDDSRDFGSVELSTCKDLISFRLWGAEGFFMSRSRFEYVH